MRYGHGDVHCTLYMSCKVAQFSSPSLPPSLPPSQLSQVRHRAQQREEEKDQIRKTMNGFVSQEKEKFERLAKHMKHQQRDLQTKSAQIKQVKDLIRNSPQLGRLPLRETQTSSGGTASTPTAVKTVPPVKGKGRKRSASENWLEHVPTSTVENGEGERSEGVCGER